MYCGTNDRYCIFSKILRYFKTTDIIGEKFKNIRKDGIKTQTKLCKLINLLKVKNEFLEKCQRNNLVPKSFYKGQHLQQGRQCLQRILRQNRYLIKINSDLVRRNFKEDGFNNTQCTQITGEMNKIIQNSKSNKKNR